MLMGARNCSTGDSRKSSILCEILLLDVGITVMAQHLEQRECYTILD